MKKEPSAIKQLLRYFYQHHRAALFTGLIAIVIVDTGELILPILLKKIIDQAPLGITREFLHQGLWYLSLIFVCLVVGRYLWRMSLSRAAMRAGAGLREDFARQIFEISFSYFERKKVGDLMNIATGDVENMRMALGPGLISLIDSLFYCLTIPFAMFALAPSLSLKMLIPVIGIPFAVLYLQDRIAILSKEVQSEIAKLGTQTQELVAGVRLTKIYGTEARMEERLNLQSKRINETQIKLSRAQATFGPGLEFFLSVSLVLLFGLGANVSVGTLVALQRYLQKLMWPMSAVGFAVVYFQKAKSSGEEFYGFLTETKAEKLGSEVSARSLESLPTGVPLIEARNLQFRVIQNLSFKVFPGEWLGISGAVASGKSTLLGLLLKFYDLPRGQLFVQGRDLNDWNAQELRSIFTSVLQDPYLFQGSVRSNLEVGDELPVLEAMETAHIHSSLILERMDEALGEKGTGLSGGQKQRIAIARALRKKSPVLLLDDPLSSVDLQTAQQVLKNLNASLRPRKKTVLFVSHHPEHLAYCDRVIAL